MNEEIEETPDTIIVITGHEVEAGDLPKMALRTYNALLEHDWVVKAGHSRFLEPATSFKGTDRKGEEKRPERTTEMNWVQAIKDSHTIDAVWHDGAFKNARFDRRLVKSTALSRLIKEEL